MKISFALLCHNETDSLKTLLDSLIVERPYEYEIVIVYDRSDIGLKYDADTFIWKPENETEKILKDFREKPNHFLHFRSLNNDYSAQKNFMTTQCSGDWVINPDADELFPEYILENIHLIIEQSDTECIWLPRINIVEGMTAELAPRFGQKLDERGWINWPDPQNRIYLNDYPRIHWEKPVHERVVGYKTHSPLPFEPEMAEHVAIKHIKTLDRQIQQNNKYAKIMG
jgi:glycosyltransferase involved in cell wall biosynthesis